MFVLHCSCRVQCVTFYGQILMIGVAGESLLVELATHLARTSQKISTTITTSHLSAELTSWLWKWVETANLWCLRKSAYMHVHVRLKAGSVWHWAHLPCQYCKCFCLHVLYLKLSTRDSPTAVSALPHCESITCLSLVGQSVSSLCIPKSKNLHTQFEELR